MSGFLRSRASLLAVAACLATWTSTGCVLPTITPRASAMVPTVQRTFDCTVGLHVPPESAEYQHVWYFFPYTLPLQVGGPAKEACLQTLKQLFAEVYEMPALPPRAGDPEPDFLIIQKIEKVNSWLEIPMSLTPAVRAELEMTWEVRDSGGQHLFSVTHTAQDSMEPSVAPGASHETLWQGLFESCVKRVVSDLINELVNQHAGAFAELVAERASKVGFLGWVCSSDLGRLAVILSAHLSGAMEKLGCQSVSEDVVRAVLAAQGVSLNGIIADTSRMVAIARSLKCGVVVVGQIEAVGENLRLSLSRFDGRTGQRTAEAEEVVQPDDVKGLIEAVERMVSSLQLEQRAP